MYICTMEYYSAIKKNEIMPFAAIWMELEIVILKEESHTEKEKYHEIPYMWNLKRNDTNALIKQKDFTDLENDLIVARRKDGGRDS